MIDLHSHILPGIDDGPEMLDQSLELARAFADQGVTVIAATPHQLGPFEGNIDGKGIVEACKNLENYLTDNKIDVKIVPGCEVRLDERIPQMLDDGSLLTLGNSGKYLLVELIPDVFIDIEPLIVSLEKEGIRIVLAHPERYHYFNGKFDVLKKWIDKGVLLQTTASSLLGRGYMPQVAMPLAFEMMARGMVAVVSSDSHDLEERAPFMRDAFEFVAKRAGNRFAEVLFEENPKRLLEGMEPIFI